MLPVFCSSPAGLESLHASCHPGSASPWQGPNTQEPTIAEVLGVFCQLPQPSHAHGVRTFGFNLVRTTLVTNIIKTWWFVVVKPKFQ